jgi:uncharacterized protein (DUF1800 family)
MRASAELALHRFGLGARPGDLAAMGDPARWLAGQTGTVPEPAGFAAFPDAAAVIRSLPDREDLKDDPEAKKDYAKKIREAVRKTLGARMRAAFVSDTPFHERLVWFWSNHLAVAINSKLRVAPFVFDYERSAIRPNVTGKYEDLLLASARHPAMLLYLDNATSAGPNSKAGRRREQGLNENYARELMELHTLGVGSGYSQDDIIALAKILSGWIVLPKRYQDRADTAFVFAPQRHEPGTKTVLGVTYDEGEAAGVAVIRALARHPATARRLAHKFAAHFTADEPEADLVNALERIYRETDGDLGALARGLIAHEAAWRPNLSKARDPIQFVTAAVRATAGMSAGQLKPEAELALLGALRTLGQLPFQAPSPQGWPDSTSAWFGPDQVVERAEWALAAASRISIAIDPLRLANDLFGSLLSETTRTAISRAPSPQEGLAMLIASPEFMRR